MYLAQTCPIIMQSEDLMPRAMNSLDLSCIGSVFVDVVTEMNLTRLAILLYSREGCSRHTT